MNWKLLGLLIVLTVCAYSQKTAAQCNDTLWNHVYNSYRLTYVNQKDSACLSVSGYIEAMLQEEDGDVHVRLEVDKQYSGMLDAGNINDEYGTLVCEPICYYAVTQADAKSSCLDFVNHVVLPKIGQHVVITGSYVFDNDHGWNELHPVTSIVPYVDTTTSGIAPLYKTELSQISVFPNPASDYVKFIFNDLSSVNKEIFVYNAVGQIVATAKPNGADICTMNTEKLGNGIYIYAVVNTLTGEVYKGKLIILKSMEKDD